MRDFLLILLIGTITLIGCNIPSFKDEVDILREQYPSSEIHLSSIEAATTVTKERFTKYPTAHYFIMVTESVEIYEVLYDTDTIVFLNLITGTELIEIQKRCQKLKTIE